MHLYAFWRALLGRRAACSIIAHAEQKVNRQNAQNFLHWKIPKFLLCKVTNYSKFEKNSCNLRYSVVLYQCQEGLTCPPRNRPGRSLGRANGIRNLQERR